jgi:hypothetical protein
MEGTRMRTVLGAAVCVLALIGGSGAALASPGTVREWTIFPSANTESGSSSLSGISCVNARHCMAVGKTVPSSFGAVGEALIESWNGSAWSVIPAPSPLPGEESGLVAVSCVSARFCVAVGSEGASCPCASGSNALIESWNGSAWSVVPTAGEAGGGHDTLRGVSCVSSRFCVAVGVSSSRGAFPVPTGSVIESWNGSVWSLVPHPITHPPRPRPRAYSELNGVSCASMSSCVAVGDDPEVESWNGTEWSVVPTPEKGSLGGVSCVSAKRCVAVGRSEEPGTLVGDWDGGTWSIIESPNPEGGGRPFLSGVSCISARSCAAVGDNEHPEPGPYQTLVETSRRSKWSIAPSANGAGAFNFLGGVSCVSNESCFAVGQAEPTPEGPSQALVENGGPRRLDPSDSLERTVP